MYRYLALILDSPDARRTPFVQSVLRRVRSRRANWSLAHESHSLMIFHSGPVADRWHCYEVRGGGAVLGTLFRRRAGDEYSAEPVSLSDHDSARIVNTEGRELIEAYWGRYVALVRGPQGKYHVLRDPTGIMPCYCVRLAGATAIFCNLEDCVELTGAQLSIDWRHVAAFLLSDRLVSDHTGFKEIVKLQAGECFTINAGRRSSSFYWMPNRTCESGAIEDSANAMQALRSAVRTSVHSWARCYRRILHGLSGGLDSSIVLACLANAGERPQVVCSNLFTPTAEGDERAYARKAAERAGYPLIETLVRPFMTDPQRMLNVTGLVSPTLTTFISVNDDFQAELVRRHGSDGIFSGQGGDHLFQVVLSNLIPAEYAQRHGLRRGFGRVLLQTSHTTRQPIWPTLRAALVHGILRRRVDPYADLAPPAFARGARAAVCDADLRHPWVEAAGALPAAKLQQVYFLVDCQILYSLICGYADLVHPLISQPVIECCLRIPSYVLTDGGSRDRALARRAFACDLPSEIAGRTSKGGANGYFHNVILDHASAIRELLLDGILVREGLLERAPLEEQLSERGLISATDMLFPIFSAIRAEAWLQEATTVAQRAAA